MISDSSGEYKSIVEEIEESFYPILQHWLGSPSWFLPYIGDFVQKDIKVMKYEFGHLVFIPLCSRFPF